MLIKEDAMLKLYVKKQKVIYPNLFKQCFYKNQDNQILLGNLLQQTLVSQIGKQLHVNLISSDHQQKQSMKNILKYILHKSKKIYIFIVSTVFYCLNAHLFWSFLAIQTNRFLSYMLMGVQTNITHYPCKNHDLGIIQAGISYKLLYQVQPLRAPPQQNRSIHNKIMRKQLPNYWLNLPHNKMIITCYVPIMRLIMRYLEEIGQQCEKIVGQSQLPPKDLTNLLFLTQKSSHSYFIVRYPVLSNMGVEIVGGGVALPPSQNSGG
eukprot:TRINITY_DN2249_c0_g1_i5.p1 TRINITY_DN2249_c0_g1~~TRINITY_DN2249_c0_g1_i5.p1  ORF type:complete len:264 (+),score=-10.94 TRINITY_DN2249_c0_g1_i5:304-1095(+)